MNQRFQGSNPVPVTENSIARYDCKAFLQTEIAKESNSLFIKTIFKILGF